MRWKMHRHKIISGHGNAQEYCVLSYSIKLSGNANVGHVHHVPHFVQLDQCCQAAHTLCDLFWGEGTERQAHKACTQAGYVFAFVQRVGEEAVTIGEREARFLGACEQIAAVGRFRERDANEEATLWLGEGDAGKMLFERADDSVQAWCVEIFQRLKIGGEIATTMEDD